MKRTTAISIFCLALLCGFASVPTAQAAAPLIVSAIVNSPAGQITISGKRLAPATGSPTVDLDGTPLTLVSASATQIVANLPSAGLGAGTYQLTVTSGTATGSFDVTYGTVGPQGPAGATGATGATGAQGIQGPTGATGATGPQGPQGPAGTITLPFAGTNTTTNYGFQVDSTGAGAWGVVAYGGQSPSRGDLGGGIGVYGDGGKSNGSGSWGGAGLEGSGGEATTTGDYGGHGGAFQGGGSTTLGVGGGDGIYATGGASGGTGTAGNGVYAVAGSPGASNGLSYGLAGAFEGAVYVNGNLAKAGGSFVIDHPTDPANKYLYHSFVESPDMMNIYNGNAVTDSSGTAIVSMPDWFEALNRDFRYQLTAIGRQAQAWVESEIANGSFTIKTDKPGVKVSWMVTGIRQDAWANAHRIPLEVQKAPEEQGHYLHPELFGHEGDPDMLQARHARPQSQSNQPSR